MAWGAAWLEFCGDGVACLFVGRVVVEFENVGALTVNTFVVMSFKHHTLLTRGGVASTVRCVDWAAVYAM